MINFKDMEEIMKISQREILNKIENYVKEICKNNSDGHDWYHIERVCRNSMLINQEEKADSFVIMIIAYLHDLYDHKFYDGEIASALKEMLQKLKVYDEISKANLENIIQSCANLSFSNNLDGKKELSIEGKIVQDADKLNAIGAIGIARCFAYGGKRDKLIYDPKDAELVNSDEYKRKGSHTSISHFYDKLLRLKEDMNTDSAKKIAEERHKYLEDFLQEFMDEWNGVK